MVHLNCNYVDRLKSKALLRIRRQVVGDYNLPINKIILVLNCKYLCRYSLLSYFSCISIYLVVADLAIACLRKTEKYGGEN